MSKFLQSFAAIIFFGIVLTGCGNLKLKPIDTTPAKTVIDKINVKPDSGGLVFRKDDFFEDDATIALGSAWLTSKDLSKAKIFFFGLDEVKPSGGKVRETLRYAVKKDAAIDAGIADVFGVKLTDSNAITITVTKRSMITSISSSQLQKWAESAAKQIEGDEAYVAFVAKISENIISTEEYTKENYDAKIALNAIKIGDASYGSEGQIKTADMVQWIGLTGCKWKRKGPDGSPSITVIPPEQFVEVLNSMRLK